MNANDVMLATFATSRFARRYAVDEVDELLDRLIATLNGEASLTGGELRAWGFKEAGPLEEGYVADEVDAFLDRAAKELDAHPQMQTPPAHEAPQAPPSAHSRTASTVTVQPAYLFDRVTTTRIRRAAILHGTSDAEIVRMAVDQWLDGNLPVI